MKLELVKEGVDDGEWLWAIEVSADRVWKVRISMNDEELFACELTPPGEVARHIPGIGRPTHFLALDDAVEAIRQQESRVSGTL